MNGTIADAYGMYHDPHRRPGRDVGRPAGTGPPADAQRSRSTRRSSWRARRGTSPRSPADDQSSRPSFERPLSRHVAVDRRPATPPCRLNSGDGEQDAPPRRSPRTARSPRWPARPSPRPRRGRSAWPATGVGAAPWGGGGGGGVAPPNEPGGGGGGPAEGGRRRRRDLSDTPPSMSGRRPLPADMRCRRSAVRRQAGAVRR